jgi:hypothetical protein
MANSISPQELLTLAGRHLIRYGGDFLPFVADRA